MTLVIYLPQLSGHELMKLHQNVSADLQLAGIVCYVLPDRIA